MDDPWANAWGDTPKSDSNATSTTPTANLWSKPFPSVPSTEDHEADLAQPSWSTGTGISWTEPPDTRSSLWDTSTVAAPSWERSSYENIPIGQAAVPQPEIEPPATPPSPLPELAVSLSSSEPSPPQSPSLPSGSVISTPTPPTDERTPPTRSKTLISPPLAAPASPDGFGTFEVALEESKDAAYDPWTPAHDSTFSDDLTSSNAWGTAWSNSTAAESDDQQEGDEWAAARRLKEMQDRHVPPEVLSDLLSQSRALCQEIWPEAPSSAQGTVPQRYDALDDLAELATIRSRIIPDDLSLPHSLQFSKTFASKRMVEALKLTRHTLLTRGSPMALYYASKGSMAWETSVKSRPEISLDADLPPGWRILEKEQQEPTLVADNKKRASSGILSFFGRKAASPTTEVLIQSEPPASPAASINKQSSSSPLRLSIDKPLPTSKLPSPVTIDLHSPVSQKETSISTPSPTSPSSATNTEPMQEVAAPQQSAVSRFLNRFSRSSKAQPSSSRRSLALSSDDLEFLSDIVPTANDDVEDSAQLRALTNMIESSPLPTKLPPPLAPPPRSTVPPPSKKAQLSPVDQIHHTPLIKPEPIQHVQPMRSTPQEDLFDVFEDGFTSLNSGSTSPQSATGHPTPSTFVDPLRPTHSSMSNGGSTRSSTPVDKSLPPIGSQSRSRTPVNPPKRTFTAIMSTTQTAGPGAIPKLGGGIGIPAQSSSARSTPVPTIIPPPTATVTTNSTPSDLFDDDDDFSEFHSSHTGPVSTTFKTLPSHSSTSSSLSGFPSSFSVSSSQGLVSQPSGSNVSGASASASFDDFDHFVSSPLRSPSPPHPPAKPFIKAPQPIQPISPSFTYNQKSPTSNPTSPSPQQRATPQTQPPKRKTSTDHSKTLSLVEAAASRKGRWPAPPSPLLEALPPPTSNRTSIDLLDGILEDRSPARAARPSPTTLMSQQQETALANFTSFAPSPAPTFNQPANHHGSNAAILSLFDAPSRGVAPTAHGTNGLGASRNSPLPAMQSTPGAFFASSNGTTFSSTLTPTSTSSAPQNKSGGLSAQDLSFFENL